MLYYRKNVGGQWEIIGLSLEEAKAIQEKIIKHSLKKLLEIKKVAEENKIPLSDETLAVILNKVAPSYESLANDYIEDKLKQQKSA